MKFVNSALLVIDVQNDFVRDTSSYSCQMLDNDLIDNISRLIEFSRNIGLPIIYTQHSINTDKSNAEFGEPEDIKACIIGTKGWHIIEKLRPGQDDIIVRKEKYDAFYNTELQWILKSYKISDLFICGVLTNNCVRATAEGAHYRGFKLKIVKDCCGATSYIDGVTHNEIHDITLQDMIGRMYDTELIKLDEIINN